MKVLLSRLTGGVFIVFFDVFTGRENYSKMAAF
jgi:hypothetical protein